LTQLHVTLTAEDIMFRRILVALDGSTFAEHALPFATQTAQRLGARLILALVHVRQAPATTDLTLRDAIEEWEAGHAQREKAYLEEVAHRFAAGDAVPEMRLLHGEVVPALLREVEQESVDLIIVTTHGRAGLERAWLGSVTDALIREADVPVLVIRPDEDGRGAEPRGSSRHVLIALDGSERAERAIAPALALVAEDGGRATLLRVVAPPAAVTSPFLPHAVRLSQEEMEQRTAEAERYLEDVLGRVPPGSADVESVIVTDYHAAHALLAYARENSADLIALTTHGRGVVTRFVMGSVTDKIVRAADVPVLVC
jgi:nucleotide-binding universal stress UspA family protein